ncbi:MAG: bifunctional adenosylcobinamide kinase/adenosylcobinamide-phosphate guanylyltransferase [Nitrospirota bacterium]|nr:bifunctional adenosylcobinamide kinase/adenosylcobinamide-phosphate guanylyltransferase [Nitrospirota bacterium]
MAGKIIFVLGGASSGKTAFAQSLCEKSAERCIYVATAQSLDEEMAAKIERHRQLRGERWRTIEAPTALSAALHGLRSENGAAVLVDCVTLWISNLLGFENKTDTEVFDMSEEFIASARSLSVPAVIVSNETGLGIVPDNALARRFRDVSGRVNQMIASASDDAYSVVAGMPMKLKGR